SLALYRTYRPGRLADVIGQEHVTVPLARAIDTGRAHHAYLFTGPRGCGKTSTARILARSLNCEQGPTSDPCGECGSCQDLAPNGPGSIDVVEMDAASHRGIDDARELREKAMYAPAASRYKVYIIDEAHQLTVDAANALLKLIEEPPPHLRFVFATTEPDKILATIRSRTHHYPYRLVTARRLQEHLAWMCDQEGVPYEAEALALVARAGAGSVRDAQSVLGQLIAGSGPEGLTYADAVAQLGFTDAALLDRVVDALADSDGPEMFAVVDSVVESGLDPRRFAADVLERLRDLVVLHEVPEAADQGLIDAPDNVIATMKEQSARLGLAQLSRAADLVSVGLSELKGATAPRLQLELLMARLLLPAADGSEA
ncbi:MAG: DNA polymerase III subunit gamma and tau, partial [Chitinophagaceae bacterium]